MSNIINFQEYKDNKQKNLSKLSNRDICVKKKIIIGKTIGSYFYKRKYKDCVFVGCKVRFDKYPFWNNQKDFNKYFYNCEFHWCNITINPDQDFNFLSPYCR